MSMNEFVDTLTDEQRAALLKALTGDDFKPEVRKPEEPVSEAVDGDFTMNKGRTNKQRTPIVARENTWTDTGEAKDVTTPEVTRTPRNRQPPKKKEVRCHSCGKTFSVSPSVMFGEYYRCDRCCGVA